MEPTRFELVFFRNDGDVDKTIRACIELNDEDMQILNDGENERLSTLAIIQRTGIWITCKSALRTGTIPAG